MRLSWKFFSALCVLLLVSLSPGLRAEQVDVASLVKQIRAVGPKGEGHREAIAAVGKLSAADIEQLTEILAGMDGAKVLPTNWLRGVAETVADRHTSSGGELPVKELEAFLADTEHAPKARRLAYELIAGVDDSAEERLIPPLLDDPSLELRRDAVALHEEKADLLADGNKQEAVALYQEALAAARDLDQVKELTQKLRDLGETVDLPHHFGFVTTWHLAAPFDNTDEKGFDVAYPPEAGVNLDGKYSGKGAADVTWQEHTTTDEYGEVDLNEVLDKHKGAIGYAYAEFHADESQPVDLRLGCINANKIWLNGELLTANEVYHANTSIDQYIGQGQLKKGKNTILLKICQNEQTEPWAQNWKFQLRVCDEIGTAVHAAR